MQAKTVLIIDDDPAIGRALTVRLESLGYRIALACDGATGIRAATDVRPDVILLDIRMPDMSGFEVCKRLKCIPGLENIPVVFVSANVKSDIQEEARRIGGAGYITKPYQSQYVIETIEGVLNSHGQNMPLTTTGVIDNE